MAVHGDWSDHEHACQIDIRLRTMSIDRFINAFAIIPLFQLIVTVGLGQVFFHVS